MAQPVLVRQALMQHEHKLSRWVMMALHQEPSLVAIGNSLEVGLVAALELNLMVAIGAHEGVLLSEGRDEASE